MSSQPQDYDAWMEAADERGDGTPTIFDLDAALNALAKDYPVDVWATRRHLRWLMRKSRRKLGIRWSHPYRGGDNT